MIPANQWIDITFSFFPREARKYNEAIEFEINGLSRQKVKIVGIGTEMKVRIGPLHTSQTSISQRLISVSMWKVEVADSNMKLLKLGALRVGQVVKKQVPLVNNSPSPITFKLNCTPTTPDLQDSSVLKVTPTQQISLPARGGACKVDVVFSPRTRIQQFTEEVR